MKRFRNIRSQSFTRPIGSRRSLFVPNRQKKGSAKRWRLRLKRKQKKFKNLRLKRQNLKIK